MAVSSDDLCQENKEILIDFNTEETRDYSYLVEVLDEVSLTVLDYNIWNSSEYSVNSSVFDMLEKKYGKQESWHKLDRKLMFDIINSGLSKIMHSFMDIYTTKRSLKRRYHFTLRKKYGRCW
uniref:Phosphatidylinositol n-acetylglucosaminyltransferase subunit p n=1 Tax=Solanum tuberosum TaxID=4113 RepID=M1D351_SOLTU